MGTERRKAAEAWIPDDPVQAAALIDKDQLMQSKRGYRIVRRLQDIFFSALAIVILLPFMLILALVIWDKNGALAEKTSFQRSLFGFAQIPEGISHRKERHLDP